MQSYTGVTEKLMPCTGDGHAASPYQRMREEYKRIKEANKAYTADADQAGNWVIRRAVVEPSEQPVERHEPLSGIPLQDAHRVPTERRTANQPTATHNELLMPCIAAFIAVLGLVTMGGYAELSQIPLEYLIPVSVAAFIAYIAYRVSSHYEKNGRALGNAMRRTHHANGAVNKHAMYERMRKGTEG